MKLRNKKTGEIIEIYKGEITLHYNQGRKTIHFKHLEDLEEWEDYEEPKEYWYMDYGGRIKAMNDANDEEDVARKEIGNYFKTKVEAEQAIERLKAWKRLKDKGFRFLGVKWLDYAIDFGVNPPYTHITFDEYTATEKQKEFYNDLMMLFGGEE